MSFLANREDLVFFAFCCEDAILEQLLDDHWLCLPLKLARILGPSHSLLLLPNALVCLLHLLCSEEWCFIHSG